MDTDTIMRQLDDLGVSIVSNGQDLTLEPFSRVPEQLRDEIRLRKPDLLNQLPVRRPLDSELSDIVRHVREDGYVLLWSNVLEDSVAFIQSDFDPVGLPTGFTAYTLDELSLLFADTSLSADSLRLIHVAKQYGGKVTDVS
jgi:hypothetical protein